MKTKIMELLALRSLTEQGICNALNVSNVIFDLNEMRTDGILWRNQKFQPLWILDTDFKCKPCHKTFPEAKRAGNTVMCRECYRIKYRPAGVKAKSEIKKKKPPQFERLTYDAVTGWDCTMSQNYLQRRILQSQA